MCEAHGIMSVDIIPRRSEAECASARSTHVPSTWYNVGRHYTAPKRSGVRIRTECPCAKHMVLLDKLSTALQGEAVLSEYILYRLCLL